MKITFLGTGEAFDESNPNNSLIVEFAEPFDIIEL